MADMSIAVPSLKQLPGTVGQREEYIAPTTDCVNDSVAPLDFSFLQLTTLEDAEREDPRPPLQGKGATPKNSDGKFIGRCLRMNNNQLSEISTLKEFVEKMFVNPMMIGWIDLSFNTLTRIDPILLEFGNLQILYLHGNNITSLREVDKLGGLTCLKKLLLHGNGIENEKGYRNYVLSTIPWLRNFDCSAVTKCDARTAENWRKMNNPSKKKKKVDVED